MAAQPQVASSANNRRKILSNPHLWIIIMITAGLLFLYYVNLSPIDNPELRWSWFWDLIVFEYNSGINGSLLCIPFIYAAVVFGWRGTLITWIASIIISFPRIQYLAYNTTILITNLLFLLIPLLLVLVLALLRSWREEVRKAEADREKERQAYLALVLKAQEDERKRIAREIHDDTTQKLWIVSNDIQRLITDDLREASGKTAAELEKIKTTVLQISDDAKRLSLALRPGILDNLGLIPALRWLVDQVNKEGGMTARITVEGPPRQLPNEVNTHLYRIAQETLNNIKRHAGATQVNVSLIFAENSVTLIVQDNGKGIPVKDFDKLPMQNKLGILGIQERSKLIGGTLVIESNEGEGTTLSLKVNDSVPRAN